MSRGPRIKPSVRRYIWGKALERPYKSIEVLIAEINEFITEKMFERPLAEETIRSEISRARNHPVSPLDEQWSVGRLAEYDIPPEALPAVLYIYEKRQMAERIDFTIREVLWIARLHKTVDDLDILERFASAYALRDKIDWILGNSVNTRGFDFNLINYLNPQRKAEVIAKVTESPGYLDPFPYKVSAVEVTEKLAKKGYDIETPGMKLLRQDIAWLYQEAMPQVFRELKRQWGQEGYVMTPDEEKYKNWIEQKWPSVLEQFKERNKQGEGAKRQGKGRRRKRTYNQEE